MTKQQALEKLELQEGATQSEIKQQYNEFYNEFQLRITNAPTEHQRKIYQKKLEELEEAYNMLSSGGTVSQDELPGIRVTAADDKENISSDPKQIIGNTSKEISENEALTMLGLKQPFTLEGISHAYEFKKKGLLKTAETTELESIKEAIEKEVLKLKLACDVLIPKATVQVEPEIAYSTGETESSENKGAKKSSADEHTSNDENKTLAQLKPEKKIQPKVKEDQKKGKRKLYLTLVASIVVMVLLAIIFIPNDQEKQTSRTTASNKDNDQFEVLKQEGDSLALLAEYDLALEKYQAAISIQESKIVSDSIHSIQIRLENDLNHSNVEIITEKAIKTEPEINKVKNLVGYITYYSNQVKYTYNGFVKNGKPHGQGTMLLDSKYYSVEKFEGEFKNGYLYQGTYTNDDMWKKGFFNNEWKIHGKGESYGQNGHYIGSFVNGQEEGLGIFRFNKGDEFEGTFSYGRLVKGTLTSTIRDLAGCEDCRKYVGEFEGIWPRGQGKCYNSSGKLIYEGEIRDGKPVN